MLQAILQNLALVGWALLIFLAAYLANTILSLWYNIKVLKQGFSKERLIDGVAKCLVFLAGLTLLSMAVTTLPLFATEAGWAVPQEFTDLFTDLAIIGIFLLVACKYIFEAIKKLTAILNQGLPTEEKKNE